MMFNVPRHLLPYFRNNWLAVLNTKCTLHPHPEANLQN